MFEDEIHNMNKTCYSHFHPYTEAKNAFILAEEIKANKINKILETKNSKDNISGAANVGNNKNKESKNNKKYQKSNNNSRVNKNSSMKCTYYGQDGHFAIKCFKKQQVKSYKGKPASLTGGKKRQFNDMNAAEAEEFKQIKS